MGFYEERIKDLYKEKAGLESSRDKYKNASIAASIIGGLLLAGLVYTGHKAQNKLDIAKENARKQDSVRVANYNKLVHRYNGLLGKYGNVLTDNYLLKEQIDSLHKVADYWAMLSEKNKDMYLEEKDKASALEGELQNELSINEKLGKLVFEERMNARDLTHRLDSMADVIESYAIMAKAQKDTMNILQDYLNTYMITRRPIREKDKKKVFLPGEKRYLPESVKQIKAIKRENRQLKKAH